MRIRNKWRKHIVALFIFLSLPMHATTLGHGCRDIHASDLYKKSSLHSHAVAPSQACCGIQSSTKKIKIWMCFKVGFWVFRNWVFRDLVVLRFCILEAFEIRLVYGVRIRNNWRKHIVALFIFLSLPTHVAALGHGCYDIHAFYLYKKSSLHSHAAASG